MKTVAWVPIKLNNERLPNKNILPLGGKPLCQHMLDTLLTLRGRGIDEIYVFCSSENIIPYLPKGVKFLQRDPALDSFKTEHYEIVESFISTISADIYLNAHVTNPFVRSETIASGLEKVQSGEHDSAHTVLELREHLWFRGEPYNFTRSTLPRTQDVEPFFVDTNLCIYRREVFAEGHSRYGQNPYPMVVDRWEAIDIDYASDFKLAEAVIALRASGSVIDAIK